MVTNMPPQRKPLPPVAKPNYGKVFDPWNSSATGHQRPDMRPGLGWRDSRNKKLMNQFTGGHTGGQRLSDTYGAGSEDFDEKLGMVVPKDVKARAKLSVMDMLARPGAMKKTLPGVNERHSGAGIPPEETSAAGRDVGDEASQSESPAQSRRLFDGLVVYINGSTAPLVSDHKLKRILADNGAKTSLHLGRRQVTHVIVGKPAGKHVGSGGGLAGGKLEKEIQKIRGCGVKFVGVEW